MIDPSALIVEILRDCEETPVPKMREELLAAGWSQLSPHAWQDPEGKLHVGPYVAWKKLKGR